MSIGRVLVRERLADWVHETLPAVLAAHQAAGGRCTDVRVMLLFEEAVVQYTFVEPHQPRSLGYRREIEFEAIMDDGASVLKLARDLAADVRIPHWDKYQVDPNLLEL